MVRINREVDHVPYLDIRVRIDLDEKLAAMESKYILKALDMGHGNRKKAADLLGINLRSLRYRLEKLNIKDDGD